MTKTPTSLAPLVTIALMGCSAPDPGALSLPVHHDAGAAPAPSASTPRDAGSPASDASNAGGAPSVDEKALLATIAGGAYVSSPEYTLSSVAYPSLAAAGSMIQEWVLASSASAFAEIDPNVSGAHTVPSGTVIIRAVRDANGTTTKLTLMCKGPAGYNPELGDWWFGVTAPDGTPLATNGVTQVGKLSACYSCHQGRASDDYLFGIPASARTSHP